MWEWVILGVLIVLGVIAYVTFQRAEPPPRRVNEEFKRRQSAGLVRDDTGHSPDQEVRRFRWWSR